MPTTGGRWRCSRPWRGLPRVALVATWLGVAAALGGWFQSSDPLIANLALTAISIAPIAFGLLALHETNIASGASRELRRLSRHDPLTDLQNRIALPDVLANGLNKARGVTMQAAALFCDLDRFKLVNDTYGHEVGDRLMVSVAGRIRDAIAPSGTAVRFGGDEFVVVHPVSGRGRPSGSPTSSSARSRCRSRSGRTPFASPFRWASR